MGKYASKVVALMQSWVGKNERDGSHKEIIDIYNGHRPLARNYKVKYTDYWCAATVSAAAIKLGYTSIIPTECGCQEMIAKFKKIGSWVENDAYVPKPGDIIFYDWQDSGRGDNTGWADHVGVVEKVSGGNITVIEGNYSDAVKRRVIAVNGRYIRGFGVPKYDSEKTTKPTAKPTTKPTVKDKVVATDDARSFEEKLAGTYKVTASALNVRHGAGKHKKIMTVIQKGKTVKCYGYYTVQNDVKWLYIQFTHNGVTYTGFASSEYLVK